MLNRGYSMDGKARADEVEPGRAKRGARNGLIGDWGKGLTPVLVSCLSLKSFGFLALFVFGEAEPLFGKPHQDGAFGFVVGALSGLPAILRVPSVVFGCRHNDVPAPGGPMS
jgi:hypothetical protein